MHNGASINFGFAGMEGTCRSTSGSTTFVKPRMVFKRNNNIIKQTNFKVAVCKMKTITFLYLRVFASLIFFVCTILVNVIEY